MVREVLTLSEYDIEIHHIKGKANSHTDASRQPDYNTGENDNQDVTVLPNHVFVQANKISMATPESPPSHNIATFSYNSTTIDHPVYEQDQDILKPWIDSHQLKNIHGTWYKGS